jgi:WD40 repeat protein
MHPCSHEFSSEFYERLNEYVSEVQVPGMIYLLKHFLHDEGEQPRQVVKVRPVDNRQMELRFRPDVLMLPFSESKVPRVVQRPHQYVDSRVTRYIPSLTVKRAGVRPPHLPSLTSMTVPADATVATMGEGYGIAYSVGNRTFYVARARELRVLRPHGYSVSALAISSTGEWVLSVDVVGGITLENVVNGNVDQPDGIREAGTAAAFVGVIFAIGTACGKVFVFQMGGRRPQRVFAFHTGGVTFVAIHPNCENIVSVAMDGTIRVYSISMGVCVRVWRAPGKIPISARFSHNGKYVVVTCTDGQIAIIDIGKGKVFRSMTIEAAIIDAVFSPSDETIAVVDKTGGFSLWDVNDATIDSLTVLRIDKIRPLTIAFLDHDEIRVVGSIAPTRFYEDGLALL